MQTLTDPDKISNLCRQNSNLISRFKIWAPLAKGTQNGGEKVSVFCKEYNAVAFLCNGTDWHEIPANSVY